MSFAIDLPRFANGQIFAAPEGRTRVLALTLAASVAIHVAAIVFGPALRRAAETLPRPLDVSLVRPPVPEPVSPPPRVQLRPPEPVKPVVRPQREQPRSDIAPAPVVEQRQVLALPESAATAPGTFSVPHASIEREPGPEGKPGPAASGAVTREAASTPAMYNAAYLRNAPPRYPLIARRNGVEGLVRLKVFVSRDGKPVQVHLDQTSGSAALDGAALDAVKAWQFVPARRGQEPIESWVLVPVVFRLEGAS